MTNPGIDYGRGHTNIDHDTGIRYGVISQHSVSQAWSESSEPVYGAPICPECGSEVVAYDPSVHVKPAENPDEDAAEYEQYNRYGCADYACEHCEHTLDSSDGYGGEPNGWAVDDGEYSASDCLDSDIIVTHSLYYTFAPFCSPCVPGAGNLDSAGPESDGGVKTYCFNHDWFEDGRAPYPVYRVSDDSEVQPD